MKKNNSTLIVFALFAICMTVMFSMKPETVYANKNDEQIEEIAEKNNAQTTENAMSETINVLENLTVDAVDENNNENLQVDNSATAENCDPEENNSFIEKDAPNKPIENNSTTEEIIPSNEPETNNENQQSNDYVTDTEILMVKHVVLYEKIVEGIENGEDVSDLIAEYESLSDQLNELFGNN